MLSSDRANALSRFAHLSAICLVFSLSLCGSAALAEFQPGTTAIPDQAPQVRLISFEDLKPTGAKLTACWDAVGIDQQQRVYVAFSDQNKREPDDTVIFRVDTRSDRRELLGTLRQISQAEGNLKEGETIAKSHVHFLDYEGKFYFGSHDYHSYKSRSEMAQRRGCHFYSFDPRTDHFEDLSKYDPEGVSAPQQGIVAMNILERDHALAALTFPMGDLLIYDLKKRRTTVYPGVPAHREIGKPARAIVTTDTGKVYFSYYDVRKAPIYELDIHTGQIRQTEHSYHFGMVYGALRTRDRSKVYLVDLFGNLYAFHLADARLEDLGNLLPDDQVQQGISVAVCYSLVLSPDEKKLYTFPSEMKGQTGLRLYEHDLATGKNTQLADFYPALNGHLTGRRDTYAHGRITGSGVVDEQGRLYFGYHEGGDDGRGAVLLQVTLTSATEAARP